MTTDTEEKRVLCRVADIPDPGAKGFPSAPGGFYGLFAVRKAGVVRVYVNSCPHIGVPLEPLPDRFLDTRKALIVCSAHGARFKIEDGHCVTGPCLGQSLEIVPHQEVDGVVVVARDAGK